MKKGMVISLLLILLVIFGCQPGALPGRRKEPVAEYRSGSQGIVMNFLPNFPRPQMFADEPLDILIELRNRGSQPVGYAGDKVYLSGFDPTIVLGLSSLGVQIPLGFEGITQFNPEGGYDNIQVTGAVNLAKMQNIDHYPVTLLATACYGYKTLASENVCIDPDPFTTSSERKVCTPAPVAFGTQGAPIAVGSVDVEATRGSTTFKINIDNAGGGTVFHYGLDNLMKCNPYHPNGLGFNDVDKVRLSKVEIAGRVITSSCKPFDQSDSSVKLINGHATIFCRLSGLGAGPAYTTPLTVELDYGYRNTISTNVDIVKVP
jgi:hypothetical protein